MGNKIKFKRGSKTKLPKRLDYGEPAFVSDEEELYIGTQSGNIKLTHKSEIEKINKQLDSIQHLINSRGNKVSVNAKSLGVIGDRVTDNTVKFQEICDLAKQYGQVEIILEDGEYITKQLLIYPNTSFKLSKNAKIVRHKDSYMLFCNLNKDKNIEYTNYNAGYFELQGGYLDGNWTSEDVDGRYLGETGAFGHLSRFTLKDTIIIDGANGDHIFDICGCDNVTIDNVEFRGVHGNSNPTECIQIDMMIPGAFPSGGTYDGTATQNVVIENCKFLANPNNSKSKMVCPIGSHGHNGKSTYKNIKIKNNYFKDVKGNTINNGIAFQYCYGAEIVGNTFDYTGVSLTAPIIDFYVHDSQTICPFKDIHIKDNVFKINECTINNKQAIRIYSNKNRAFRIPKVSIKNNECTDLDIIIMSSCDLDIEHNKCKQIETGWIEDANIEYNKLSKIDVQATDKLFLYKNVFTATGNKHQFYNSAGVNKNLQILDNTFDAKEYTGVTALKWITSDMIKINDNTFINCDTVLDNDWNGITSTNVEFKNNISNLSKDVKIKRATGTIICDNNTNLKLSLSSKDVKCNNNICEYIECSATKSVVCNNNSVINGRLVFSNTPSINVNSNVITNPTANNIAINVITCKGSVSNNIFIQTDTATTYPNILINVNELSSVITSNNDTRNAKVNTSFVNNTNEGFILHRNLNKKIFVLKISSTNTLELTELPLT